MSKPWDGRPERPERDGAHVLSWRGDDPEQAWWIAKDREWLFSGRDTCATITAGNNARYLGPCLTPDEVTAREVAAAMLMQKRCQGAACMVSFDAANRIAALPIPAAAAPARALDQARAEEREACADIVSKRAASRFSEAAHCRSDRLRKHIQIRADEAGQIAALIRARGKEVADD